MSSDSPHPSPEASDHVWQEIDRLLDELTGLSKSERPAAEFHAECLRRVVGGLGAAGGIFWVRSAGGPLQADARIVPPSLDLTPAGDAARQARIAAAVLAAGSGEALPPGASAAAGGDENATEFLLLLGPWIVGNEVAGVLQIFLSPGAGPRAQRGYLDFLQVVGELIVEFHRRRQLRNYRLWAADLKRLQDFAEQVHRSLDLKETAYTIANEVRQLAACDRVSVVVRQAVRCRLLAVSGVATVNRRADAVRQLERLADRVCVFGEPLWYPDGANDLPPELDRQLHAHLDESHANVLAVLPLVSQTAEAESPGGAAVGALVVERFQGTLDEPLRWNVLAVRGHCALALQHAREVTRMPLGRLLRALGRGGGLAPGRRLGAALVLAAVLVTAAALAVIPAEFRLEARGELQPVRVRDVFAPADGVVGDLRVRHRQQVAAGEVLAVLRRSELDLQFQQVWGALQTARKQFAAVEAERMQNLRETAEQRLRYGQLTAQQEELREQIASLEAQHAVLEQQHAELEVRSPQAGEVLTWNPAALLEARPVARGQILLTVGDLAGPWQLELRVPDRRIAHVLAAQRRSNDPLPVSFLLASDSATTLYGSLAGVGLRTEIGQREGAFIPATVAFDRDQVSPLIPGAGVTAKIHCGRRPLGYVWFHDLLDAVRSWLLF